MRVSADSYIYNPVNPGASGLYWDTTGQAYSAWYDQTTGVGTGTPFVPAGGSAQLSSAGSLGVSGTTVQYNHAYTGTAGIASLIIDSNNTLLQQDASTALVVYNTVTVFGSTNTFGGEYIGYTGVGSYNQSAGTHRVTGGLSLGFNAGASGSYALSGGTLSADNEFVGYRGAGSFTQSGNSTNTAGGLYLGYAAQSSGSYTLNDDATLSASNLVSLGGAGVGTFIQQGGMLSVTTSTATSPGLMLGQQTTGVGSWQMNGGTARIYGTLTVGSYGSGLAQLAAGNVHVALSSAAKGTLEIGQFSGSSGTVTVGNALLIIDAYAYVGDGGHGVFTQSGGTTRIASALYVGSSSNSLGIVNLSGGSMSTSATYLGQSGAAYFNQSGGTFTTSTLTLGGAQISGQAAPSTAILTLNAGTLNVTAGEYLGQYTTASVIQTGGVQTVGSTSGTNGLYIGVGSSFNQTFGLSGGTLAVNGALSVGYNGMGTFTQAGGSASVAAFQNLYVGQLDGGSGTFNLSGTSALTLGTGASEYVGFNGKGVFSQSGGTQTIGGSLIVGAASGASGTYTLSGGSLSVLGSVIVGSNGAGIFNLSGGSMLASSDLTLANYYDYAAFSMSNGATLTVKGSENISVKGGVATFTQTGGAHTVSGTVGVGWQGGTGTYAMSGGTLAVAGALNIGGTGNGTLNLLGGSVTADTLNVQALSNQPSVVTVSNGATLTVNSEFIAQPGFSNASATLNQFGGTQTVASNLVIQQRGALNLTPSAAEGLLSVGGDEHVEGSLTQTGGQHLIGNAATHGSLYLGDGNSGTVRLSDGVLSINGNLYSGSLGSTGNLYLNGGTTTVLAMGSGTVRGMLLGYGTTSLGQGSMTAGTLSVAYKEAIGQSGLGSWNQSGGSNQTPTFLLGEYAGSQGTATLSGGLLNASSATDIGNGGIGRFTLNGGTHSTGSLALGVASSGSGTYTLSAGTLTVLGAEQIGVGGAGVFTQTGGVHTVAGTLTLKANSGGSGTLNLSGGSLSAAATVNNGRINLTGGNASLGGVSGTGSITQAIGSPQLNVTQFSQGAISLGGRLQTTASAASVTNAATTLTLSNTGSLDLTNQNLLTSSPASQVRQYLTDGYNGGAWNGTAAAIVSTSAASSPASAARTLGYATGNFDSVSIPVPAGQTLVKFTVPGDADLSGTVDYADFQALQSDFGQAGDWAQGDFNYDGVVNFADFMILQNAYGESLSGGNTGAVAPSLATPEPVGVGLGAVVLAGLLRRKRLERRR